MDTQKTVLILIDGMRSDAIAQCGEPWAQKLIADSASCLEARTVMPSVTLPCHMSLFYSVDVERHGVTTNFFSPMVRPLDGLIECLSKEGKKSAFFYTWEHLRDLTRPGGLAYSLLINMFENPDPDDQVTDAAIAYIQKIRPDFVFLYLGDTDEAGHDFGWMGEKYLDTVANAWRCVRRVRETIPEEYNIIVTADHGGHDRTHGTDLPEDMTIPVICNGPAFPAGTVLKQASIKDIAPTIARLAGVAAPKTWEGHPLLE